MKGKKKKRCNMGSPSSPLLLLLLGSCLRILLSLLFHREKEREMGEREGIETRL